MTRNLYLGADIERVVAAVGDPVAVGRAMLELRATVAATDSRQCRLNKPSSFAIARTNRC